MLEVGLLLYFNRLCLADDHGIQRTAVDRSAGYLEDQFERVISKRKLTRIVPAYLIGGCCELLIEGTDENLIHVNVKLAKGDATFVDQAERLTREGEGDGSAVLYRFPIGTVVGLRGCYRLPA